MEPSLELHIDGDELRAEYDLNTLSSGVRGKYAHRLKSAQTHTNPERYEQTSSNSSTNGKHGDVERIAFMERMYREMVPILERSVVLIFRYRSDIVEIHGTGTLFQIDDHFLLITASHVITTAEESGYALAISDTAPRSPLLPLHGCVRGNDLETRDFAIWELPEELVKQLPNRSFLSLNQTDRGTTRPQKGCYMICGYPEELVQERVGEDGRRKMRCYPMTSFAAIYEGDTELLENYYPKDHILLNTRKQGVELLTEAEVGMPNRVHGMSGCAIWQVFYEGLSPKHWTTQDAVIVAVQTGVYKNGDITKGTRWWHVEELLTMAYPNAKAMEPLAQ